jgi:hypothetical protein
MKRSSLPPKGNRLQRGLLVLLLEVVALPIRLGDADPDLNIAVKGGFDAATLDHEFRENRYDFSGGIAGYVQRSISERFSLGGQIDFLYTPRGTTVVFEDVKQGEFRHYYIDLVAAVRPGMQLGRTSVYLLLGAGLNLMVSATLIDGTGSPNDITSDLHRIDVALLGGAGVNLHIPRQTLGPFHFDTVFLEARHDIGLLDTFHGTSEFKSRTTSLMLGLSFGVGGS